MDALPVGAAGLAVPSGGGGVHNTAVAQPQPNPSVSWRSVLLGLVGVVLICGVTPYNDAVLNNTFLVGNNLPVGVVMLGFLFAVAVNGPLNRFAPRWAFSSGELLVALAMTLVSCALPGSGFMRYWPGSLVGPFWFGATDAGYRQLLEGLDLPAWLFPRGSSAGVEAFAAGEVVRGFMYQLPPGAALPLRAWLTPLAVWGVFLFALFGALMCLLAIVRGQWIENERLAFPLAQIQLPLILRPPPGRWLNESFARRGFWSAFAAVFALHLWNGAGRYWPAHIPAIPVWYDLGGVMSQPPWVYVDYKLKNAAVFLTVVGVTYFVARPVAFSLWFFFILQQIYRMLRGSGTGEPADPGIHDQTFGGLAAYGLMLLWLGRRHWGAVAASALSPRASAPPGRYLPHPLAVWGLAGCMAILTGWLVAAGASVMGAMVLVALLLFLFMIITRIIAETGLVHGQLQAPLYKPWQVMAVFGAHPVSERTFFLTALVNAHHFDFRAPMPVYTAHAMKLADDAVYEQRSSTEDSPQQRGFARRLVAALFLALLVGYLTSFASTLWSEYRFAATRDQQARFPINDWGSWITPRQNLLDPALRYQQENVVAVNNPALHAAGGFLITGALAWGRIQWPAWGLHPVGFLMRGTYPQDHLWFSIFLGWLVKTLVLRFGGARLFVQLKPLFLGLIIGEALAAGFWLVLALILSAAGLEYQVVNIMPG